jgi:hypothetical protein
MSSKTLQPSSKKYVPHQFHFPPTHLSALLQGNFSSMYHKRYSFSHFKLRVWEMGGKYLTVRWAQIDLKQFKAIHNDSLLRLFVRFFAIVFQVSIDVSRLASYPRHIPAHASHPANLQGPSSDVNKILTRTAIINVTKVNFIVPYLVWKYVCYLAQKFKSYNGGQEFSFSATAFLIHPFSLVPRASIEL